jgi:signal transduction histidine kinase
VKIGHDRQQRIHGREDHLDPAFGKERPQWIDGQSIGRVWSFRDVTERRRTGEQLLQAQKMEAIGRMAGGVAHDFNNIRSVILSYASLAAAGLPEGHPSRDDLEEVRSSAERAASLTRQLLAFSRKQVIAPRVISLNDVVAESAKLLERLIGEDIALTTDLDPARGTVLADPVQVEQVLFNLTINSRDAMPRGGRITLATTTRRGHAGGLTSRFRAGVRRALRSRHRSRHGRAGPEPALRAVLHDQGDRQGTGLGLSTV